MASESAPAPVNGNYAPSQEGSFNTTAAPPSASGKGAGDIPQDEVGWYFVEQYYTTLSRSPEKLFLFYNKRSQFVSGVEEEKVSVCIGQKSINERIKELDFQDCKVRITNVDSQGSDQNIVIQVIGEISNKHAPHRKFVQTFVLAGQTNGYFVLNDVFRYILDEEPEIEGEDVQESSAVQESAAAAPADSDDKGLASSSDSVAQETTAAKVDEELEEVIKSEKAEAAPEQVNGTPVAEKEETAEEAPAPVIPAVPEAPAAVEAAVAEEVKEPEKPKEPVPTKTAPTPKASPAPPAVPAAAPKPAAPKTWASLAASANRVAMPAIPTSSAPSASQPKPAPAAQAPATAAAAAAPSAPAAAAQTPAQPPREPSPGNSGSEGWQTAGQEHSKRQSRAQNQAPASENAATRAYIKNVYENVDGDALKKELARFGEIAYFDISRQKNCAFVDFATLAGFQAAVAGNPHTVGDSQIYVEERRLRPNSFAFQRGGGVPRGRGDRPVGQGRGSFKQDGNARGGFQARGRGAGGAPRGRGSSQAA